MPREQKRCADSQLNRLHSWRDLWKCPCFSCISQSYRADGAHLQQLGLPLGLQGGLTRPFWSRAAQALAQDWEAQGQTGSSALLLRISFIFVPYFLSPDQVSSPGKHFSSPIDEDSFLLCCQWVIHFFFCHQCGILQRLFKICKSIPQNTRIYTTLTMCKAVFQPISLDA